MPPMPAVRARINSGRVPNPRPPRTTAPGGRRPNFESLWLAVPLAAYILVPTHNYYWDGVSAAINVERHAAWREIFTPTHLVYTLVHTWLFRAALALGLRIRSLYLMQFVNSLLAAACAPLMFRALERRLHDRAASIAGSLLFAFSATWWRFASDANAYIPSVFFVLCAFDLIETDESPVLAGLATALAMLFHELAIFFIPFALLRLKDRRKAMLYVASAMGPVVIAYILAYRAVSDTFSIAGLFGWITAVPPVGVGHFSFQPLHNLLWTLIGTGRLFFGGRAAAIRALPIPSAVALAVMVALLVWRFRKTGAARFSRPQRHLLIWLAIYVVFLFFWLPENTFYRMFYLAPLVLILCTSFPRAGLLCAAAFVLNGLFIVYPQSRVENNVPLRFALQQSTRWPTGTPIVFSNFHTDLWTIAYFNSQVSWIGMPKLDLPVLDRAYDDSRRRYQLMWLESSAYDMLNRDPAGRAWLQAHPVGGVMRFHNAGHDFTFYQLK